MRTKIKIGDKVRIAEGCDETFEPKYKGRRGTVVRTQESGANVGESTGDPFITVQFDYFDSSDGFWAEELEKL